MLPHTVIMVCTLWVYPIELCIYVLLLTVQELNLLIISVSDNIRFCVPFP